MTLEEEYENQQSWRTARDKLTFILCAPLGSAADGKQPAVASATKDDAQHRMRGDINFFLYPYDSEDGEDEGEGWLTGEVDVMIAEKQCRGQGIGKGAVCALLVYIQRHMGSILEEHAAGQQLKGLMVKIKEANAASRALFRNLGFVQKGDVNYFGEVLMVMEWDDLEKKGWWEPAVADYCELSYRELQS